MRAAAIWICVCAFLNCAGWTLSAMHALNVYGCAAVLIFGLGTLVIWRKKTSETIFPEIRWQKLNRRFSRPFPAIFLFVAILIFLGGALHAPNNYDALTYRLPRQLNWLAAGHWFWIPTANEKLNYSTTAWEWISMPFLAVLRSDRGLFLINALGFLLMPGLFFSVCRQMGAARRVAWTWMWIFPLAYGCATQAGSVGNDFTGTVFCLAAICFGLRARRSRKIQDVWLCGLAAALMTGTKLSNLPLLLPCLVAVWPALIKLREKILPSLAVACAAVVISSAPTMALNQIHAGSWSGDPKNVDQMQIKNPAAAFLGNGLLLAQQSFMPPVLPGARHINDRMNEQLPAAWRQTLETQFPRYYLSRLNELPQEEAAGLGLGVTVLLLAGVIAAAFGLGRKNSKIKIFSSTALVGFAAWIAALFFMCKIGSEAGPRLMLPYYSLVIIPILLLPSQNFLLKFCAWKILCALAALSVLPAIVLSPARPLFPAESLTGNFAQHHPNSALAQRLTSVYSTYAHRNDSLAPLRDGLRDDARKIGFAAGTDDADYSLWRPFGHRQVVYLRSGEQKSVSVPAGVEWIVVKRTTWPELSALSLEDWVAEHHAKIVLSVPITTVVAWGAETWCLLHVEKP